MNFKPSGKRNFSLSQIKAIYQRQCQELQRPKYIEIAPLPEVCQIIIINDLHFHYWNILIVNQITDLMAAKETAVFNGFVIKPEK